MALLTFSEINDILVQHRLAEAANRSPLAVACRALDDLREALGLLEAGERDEVLGEIREMVEGERGQ